MRKSSSGKLPQSDDDDESASANGSTVKKPWLLTEDNQLRELIEQHGTGNWTNIAEFLPGRSGKQCRERWHNHLNPGIKKGEWTPEEDKIIVTMQRVLGNQWAKITKMLPGRTDNAVKNRFHATERARNRNIEKGILNSDGSYSSYFGGSGMTPNGSVSMDSADMTDLGLDEVTVQQIKAASANGSMSGSQSQSQLQSQVSHYSPSNIKKEAMMSNKSLHNSNNNSQNNFVPIIDSFPSPRFDLDADTTTLPNMPASRGSQKRSVSSLEIPAEMTNSTESYHNTEQDGDMHDIDFSFLIADPHGHPQHHLRQHHPQAHESDGNRTFDPSPDSVPDIDDGDIDWSAHESAMHTDAMDNDHDNRLPVQISSGLPRHPLSRQGSNQSIGCGALNVAPQLSIMQNMCGFNLQGNNNNNNNHYSKHNQVNTTMGSSKLSSESINPKVMAQSYPPSKLPPQHTPSPILFQQAMNEPPLNLVPVPGHPNLYYNPNSAIALQQQQQQQLRVQGTY